jgi:4a-hydroxytetrahydrobiopterin dehydratase
VSEPLSRPDFTASAGTSDWRIVVSGACAQYRTAGYPQSIALVGAAAEAAGNVLHPEFEVRERVVLVRLPAPDRRLTTEHLRTARAIADVAADLGVIADPAGIQDVQVTFDAEDVRAVQAFWAAALGFEPIRHSHLRSPDRIGPTVFVQEKPYRSPRNRIHVDISIPPDQVPARIEAILAAGGRVLGDQYAPEWWSLIDPEGNVVDLATWEGRDEGD